jgi:membrane protein implicated in regulation of membrane protease activity
MAMSHGLTIVLLLLTGFIMAFVVMIASSGLSAYYIVETVRRVLRTGRRARKP